MLLAVCSKGAESAPQSFSEAADCSGVVASDVPVIVSNYCSEGIFFKREPPGYTSTPRGICEIETFVLEKKSLLGIHSVTYNSYSTLEKLALFWCYAVIGITELCVTEMSVTQILKRQSKLGKSKIEAERRVT